MLPPPKLDNSASVSTIEGNCQNLLNFWTNAMEMLSAKYMKSGMSPSHTRYESFVENIWEMKTSIKEGNRMWQRCSNTRIVHLIRSQKLRLKGLSQIEIGSHSIVRRSIYLYLYKTNGRTESWILGVGCIFIGLHSRFWVELLSKLPRNRLRCSRPPSWGARPPPLWPKGQQALICGNRWQLLSFSFQQFKKLCV